MNIPKLLKHILQLLLIISFAAFLYSNSFAATFTVVNTNDSGLGSLRQAILDANVAGTDDTIDFVFLPIDPNCSIGVCTITLTTGELVISNSGSLAINGTGAENLIISGNNASRVLRTSNGVDAQINDVTIREGNGMGIGFQRGGGVYNGNATLEITDSNIISNSSTSMGGGIYNDDGTLEITNSIINSNSANQGGGIYNDFGRVKIINSTLDRNTLSGIDGGGIYNNEGLLELISSTVSNNSANGSGGGIRSRGGSDTKIINSTISSNTSILSGAGIEVCNGSVISYEKFKLVSVASGSRRCIQRLDYAPTHFGRY